MYKKWRKFANFVESKEALYIICIFIADLYICISVD